MLLVRCYIPCDTPANANMFRQIFGALQELKTKYSPDYVIYGGDYNVDMSRLQPTQTYCL